MEAAQANIQTRWKTAQFGVRGPGHLPSREDGLRNISWPRVSTISGKQGCAGADKDLNTGKITGFITGLVTGIWSPVPPAQAIEFAQNSGSEKFLQKNRLCHRGFWRRVFGSQGGRTLELGGAGAKPALA
jgi:hypothetical protein